MNLQQIESPRKFFSPNKKRKRNEETLTEKAMKHFEFERTVLGINGDEKHFYKCLICLQSKNGTNNANLAAHLKSSHFAVFSEMYDGKKDPLPIKRLKLLQNCTEIISTNGRPFNSLLDSGFQSIIRNKCEKLRIGGCPLNLSDPHLVEVKTHLSETAQKIRSKIKNEVKDRALGLMVDIVSKHHRSILGVSIQYACNGKLRVRSIGMIDLEKRHTGIYLAEKIIERLKIFEIEPIQILTITTDNGANVLKMIRDIENLQETCVNEQKKATNSNVSRNLFPDFSSVNVENAEIENILLVADDNITDEEALDILFEDVELERNSTLLSAISTELSDKGVNVLWDISGVNCAAHTLQLAIKDALNKISKSHSNVINIARTIVKFLRLKTTTSQMDEIGLKYKLPRLENDTRWCSLYLMVCSDSLFV